MSDYKRAAKRCCEADSIRIREVFTAMLPEKPEEYIPKLKAIIELYGTQSKEILADSRAREAKLREVIDELLPLAVVWAEHYRDEQNMIHIASEHQKIINNARPARGGSK
jgi:hypothetical protein